MMLNRWCLVAVSAVFLCGLTPVPAAAGVSDGLDALFPDGLRDKAGKPVSTDVLKDKVVGIYFSAHWCPPCRKFTPELVKYHAKNKDDFEVVFVSSDKGEKEQFSYMKETKMRWPTMKYKSDAANALKKKYEISGIPTLVIVDGEGKTITRDGRAIVNEGVPASRLAKARVVKEEYTCSKCDKVHVREKVVYAE